MERFRINIIIVEPSVIIYEGLSSVLLQEGRTQCRLSHYDSIQEMLPALEENNVDLVIINPSLIKNDIDSFIQTKMAHQSIFWIALLYAFIEKDILVLFDDIIQITDGVDTIAGTMNKLLSSEHRDNKQSAKEQLSQREIDVLKLLVQGLLNKEIAEKLNISTHTVISHRKNIVQKTGIKSQAGLTIYAISNKLINIEDY